MSETNSPGAKSNGANGRARRDGFVDMLGGFGRYWPATPIPGDNKLYANMTRYWQNKFFNDDVTDLYKFNGIAATIIDRPSDDCFARGVVIENDEDELIKGEYDRLSVLQTMADALRWARLFGASAILIIAQDGGTLTDPLDLDSLETIEDLKVYDVRHIKPTDKLYTDPTDPMFGKPEYFEIYPPGAETFEVHETRLIPFSGDPLPNDPQTKINVWWLGRPVLDVCKESIRRLTQAYEWTVKLLERKQQGIYKMHGLGDLVAQDMEMIIQKRINNVDYARNNLNSVVVDAEDDYDIKNLGLDNLQNVIGELQIAVCADSRFPSVILFGKSATSLNTTGAGELENYYGMIGLIRARICKPALEHLTAMLWLQKQLAVKVPDKWQITFEPLWVPDDKTQAETKFKEAQAKDMEVTMLIKLMDAGLLLPEEVRHIVVDRYSEYDFPADTLGRDNRNKQYAQSVGGHDTGGVPNA